VTLAADSPIVGTSESASTSASNDEESVRSITLQESHGRHFARRVVDSCTTQCHPRVAIIDVIALA
jgi:hypothetical protein